MEQEFPFSEMKKQMLGHPSLMNWKKVWPK